MLVDPDRATRWVYMRTYRDQTDRSSADFLRRLKKAAPMHIKTILTDNGFSSQTDSQARKRLLLASMRSIWSAQSSALIIASFGRAIRKPTAWSSASMAAQLS